MIKSFSITEMRRNLKKIFNCADEDGMVRITHRNGKAYILRPENISKSPFDVPGLSSLDVNIAQEEILDSIRESRERDPSDRHEDH